MSIVSVVNPFTESDFLESTFGNIFLSASICDMQKVQFGNISISYDSNSEVLFQTEDRVCIKIGYLGKLTLTRGNNTVLFELNPFSGKVQIMEYSAAARGTFTILQDLLGIELEERRTCLLNNKNITFSKGKFFLNPKRQVFDDNKRSKKCPGRNMELYHDLH